MALFFHHGIGEMQRDEHGTELRDGAEAYSEAVQLAGELLSGIGEQGYRDRLLWRMIVTDEHGRTVTEISISAERHQPS